MRTPQDKALGREIERLRQEDPKFRAALDAALAVDDEEGTLEEDVAETLRVISNDMANAGVDGKWWRAVFECGLRLEGAP